MPAQRADRRWEWKSTPTTGGRDAAAGIVDSRGSGLGRTVQGKATTSQCDMTGEAAGVLGGKGIPCRRRWGVAGVQRRGGGRRGLLHDAKATRMKPTGRGDSSGSASLWATRVQRSTGGCRRADGEDEASECSGGRGHAWATATDREAESTHHRLRRYRRRVFLILPGPIWGMLLRHDCCDLGRARGGGRRIRCVGPGAVDEGAGG